MEIAAVGLSNAFSTEHRSRINVWIGVLAVSPVLALLSAELLMSQPLPMAHAAGRAAHFIAIMASGFIVLLFAKSPWAAAALILLTLSLRLLGDDEIYRFGYLLALSILFASAGYCVATYARAAFHTVFLALLGANVIVATAQLAGIHEVFYAWSAHGTLADGSRLVVTPTPTLFRGVSELDTMNFVQARPSGIFASNQLFSIFLLFAAALIVLMKGRLALVAAALLGLAAALTLAKAIIFGIPILAVAAFLLIPSARRQAVHVVVSLIAALLLYKLLFPGTLDLMLNPQIIVTSFIVRGAGILDMLGMSGLFQDLVESSEYVQQSVIQIERAQMPTQISTQISTLRPGDSATLYEHILSFSLHSAVVVGTMGILAVMHCGKMTLDRLRVDAIIVLAMLLIGTVANVASSMLFWHLAGFGAALLFARAFCACQTSPMGAMLAQALEPAASAARKNAPEAGP